MFSDNGTVDKKKSVVDQEVDAYRMTKLAQAELEIAERKAGLLKEVAGLAVKCAEQKGDYEHDYHSSMQAKEVELAKLDGTIACKEATIDRIDALTQENRTLRAERDNFKAISEARLETINGKEANVKLLDDIVKVVIAKLPKMEVGVDKVAITVEQPKRN